LNDDTAPYNDGPILGFAIAGKDGKFQPASAKFLEKATDGRNRPQSDKHAIVLTSPLVSEPVQFRYAWGRNPLANLKSSDHTDIPFATQRSDNWTLADMYEIYTGKKGSAAGLLNGNEQGQLRKVLRAADLERRIAVAKSLLQETQK
jgi:sialate O-acetylesterase